MTIISWIQLVVAVLLVGAILLQQRSSGLGMTFGGGAGGSYYTRRGFEKFLSQATSALAIIFIVVSIAQMFV